MPAGSGRKESVETQEDQFVLARVPERRAVWAGTRRNLMEYKAQSRARRIGLRRGQAAVLSLIVAATAGLMGTETAGASTSAALTRGGTEHFQTMVTSQTAATVPLEEWGAIGTAGGVAHPGASSNVVQFVFADGSYKLIHSNPVGPVDLNPRTCLLRATEHGTYRVSGGTGKYQGIVGNGKFTASIVAILARAKSGACDENANPVAFQRVLDGSGTDRRG
jgi:hypothetical protein